MAHIVIIEGNISAGKSTLTAHLKESLGYRVFLEPTLTNPYLEKFYADPPAYALKMQLWLLRQRFRMYVAAVKHVKETGQGVILDRSVYSDWVFAEKNRVDGNISAEGYDYYMRLRTQMLESLPVATVTVYLHVRPEVCFDRVHKMRGRDCESGIPLAYLQGLDDVYQMFVNEMRNKGSAVLHCHWDNFGDSAEIAAQVRASPVIGNALLSSGVQELLDDDALVLSRQALAHPEYDVWYSQELAANLHCDEHVDAENAAVKEAEKSGAGGEETRAEQRKVKAFDTENAENVVPVIVGN